MKHIASALFMSLSALTTAALANPYLAPAAPAAAASPMVPGVVAAPTFSQTPRYAGPFQLPIGMNQKGTKPYEMSGVVTREEKAKLMGQMLPMMSGAGRMDAKDMMILMSTKYKAAKGLSFDDVVASMELRANKINMKRVGHNPMWKDFEAVLGDTTRPRMEVFHYCDIAAGREVLKFAPESIVYLPCRVAVMEDNNKQIWVLTLDWDTAWLSAISGHMGVPDDLVKAAQDIRFKLDDMMKAAANGDL